MIIINTGCWLRPFFFLEQCDCQESKISWIMKEMWSWCEDGRILLFSVVVNIFAQVSFTSTYIFVTDLYIWMCMDTGFRKHCLSMFMCLSICSKICTIVEYLCISPPVPLYFLDSIYLSVIIFVSILISGSHHSSIICSVTSASSCLLRRPL